MENGIQIKGPQDIVDLFETLKRESDRGAFLVGIAHIDDLLGDLIAARFIADVGRADALPREFGRKINLAFCFGLISENERADLDALRQARNKFAHLAIHIDFADANIKDVVGSLSAWRIYNQGFPGAFGELAVNPRIQFAYAILALSMRLRKRIHESVHATVLAEPLPWDDTAFPIVSSA